MTIRYSLVGLYKRGVTHALRQFPYLVGYRKFIKVSDAFWKKPNGVIMTTADGMYPAYDDDR